MNATTQNTRTRTNTTPATNAGTNSTREQKRQPTVETIRNTIINTHKHEFPDELKSTPEHVTVTGYNEQPLDTDAEAKNATITLAHYTTHEHDTAWIVFTTERTPNGLRVRERARGHGNTPL